MQIGTVEIGAPPGPLASGLSLDVDSKQVRIAKDEKLIATIKGVFKPFGKTGLIVFAVDGKGPMGLGPMGTCEIQASFTPSTADPRTLYRGESFARARLITVAAK